MKTIVSIIATLAVGATAAFSAPTVDLKLGGKKFGDSLKFTAQSQGKISASKFYKFDLSGTCTGSGGLAKLAPAGTSIAKFVDSISPGTSEELSGLFENTSGRLPVEFINRKISGSRNVPGVGKVTVKATILGGADSSGKVYLSVTKVKILANGVAVPGFIKFDKGTLLTVNTSPIISLKAVSQGVNEGDGSVSIVVFRTGNTKGTATVQYATTDGTADSNDYTAQSGTLTFAKGQTQKTISVPILDNGLDDGARTFTLTLTSPGTGVTLGAKTTNTVTIFDND